jgi:hypothetical protein
VNQAAGLVHTAGPARLGELPTSPGADVASRTVASRTDTS